MARAKKQPALRELGTARPKEPAHGRRGVSPRFKELVEAHDWKGKVVVDIGCGSGAGTVLAAVLGATAVGVDIDPLALMEASERALEEHADSARFVCADAELVDFRLLAGAPGGVDGVLAHLCFSDTIATKAAAALKPGGTLIVRCFHRDMWKEAGDPAPFAYSEAGVRRLLNSRGLEVLHLEVERRKQKFRSIEVFVEEFLADPARRARWQEDGRLATLRRAFAKGGRTLTEAFIVLEAVKSGARPRPRASAKKLRKS